MSNIKGRFRWCVIGLIGLATVINYIDRNALAVMWPEVSKDIGATKEDYALLVTIFMIFYAFGQSLFGRGLVAVQFLIFQRHVRLASLALRLSQMVVGHVGGDAEQQRFPCAVRFGFAVTQQPGQAFLGGILGVLFGDGTLAQELHQALVVLLQESIEPARHSLFRRLRGARRQVHQMSRPLAIAAIVPAEDGSMCRASVAAIQAHSANMARGDIDSRRTLFEP